MKNLILFFGLVLISSCQREEKDFPKTLEELTTWIRTHEKKKEDEKLANCNSKLVKKLCKNSWSLPIGIGATSGTEIILNEINQRVGIGNFVFKCDGTWHRRKYDFATFFSSKNQECISNYKWDLKSDTLLFFCEEDDGSSYEYLIAQLDSNLVLEPINSLDIMFPFQIEMITWVRSHYGGPEIDPDTVFFRQQSLLPYFDSLNASK